MSEQALSIIDNLLEILAEANKAPNAVVVQAANGPVASTGPYLDAAESAKVGMTVRVTTDMARLKKCWQDSELGPNDDLKAYLGCVGKVMEIEDDDETLQIRWANLDTMWIPAMACQDAQGAEETLPGSSVSWLGGDEEKAPEGGPTVTLFKSIDQIRAGVTVQVTGDLTVLTAKWEEAELGPNDTLQDYLGAIGKVMEIEDDDDTLQLRWLNLDTCWIPALACGDANGAKETIPGGQISWLPPTQEDDNKERIDEKEAPQLPPDGQLLESVNDVSVGQRVKVTRSADVLRASWEEAELGPNDELEAYLGCVGEVREIEEDDDTLQVRWGNLDTCWMPSSACYITEEELSIPSKKADWIA